MESNKLRKLDYIIGYIICFTLNAFATELPLNVHNIIIIALGSCIFSVVFGAITNFIFQKRK